jgi:hypothetical protein
MNSLIRSLVATSLVVLVTFAASRQRATCAEPELWRATFAAATRAELWRPLHGVATLDTTPQGLRIAISGDDPYIESPAIDFPADQKLLVKFRLRSDVGGGGQLFYYNRDATEERSVRFPAPAGHWHDVVLALPALGRGYRFRFDPPGDRGDCLLADFRVTRPLAANFPTDLKPAEFLGAADDRLLRSGSVTLRHAARRWHDFQLSLDGRAVAAGHSDPWIAYELSGTVHGWRFTADPQFVATATVEGERLRIVGEGIDPHGARWRLEQTFVADGSGGFDSETRVAVDRERRLVFLPSLAVLVPPDASRLRDSRRKVRRQALLAGVEYLEDEPSSSEADLAGPAALRRVPAPHKPTFPLMAMQQNGVCVSLSWRRQSEVAPLFDWPDRLLGSQGSVMALIAPGAESTVRDDGEPLPHSAWTLMANRPLAHRGHLRVELGETVLPAVKAYVRRRGLPPLPTRPPLEEYIAQAAAGWLDGPLRDGARFRHAVGNDFPAQPAFDAAWMLDALASASAAGPRSAAWKNAVDEAANKAAAAVASGQELFAQVGHLQPPLAGLARGRFREIQPQAASVARRLLDPMDGAFDADGIARYRPPAQGIDYSRTHDSREANGFAALPVLRALQAALHAGDRVLVNAALERLRALERFHGGVPRGAQTWEIPLHTPDILAAAHLVKAYALAYRVTGEPRFLELAREWAWTGVPFVYLDPLDESPTGANAVGPYATIAVLGATQWKAPVWIGLPVQWCGLVYADALRWLQPHDPDGPWERLADGITLSAIQQCYPLGHPRAGLLPDSFDLVLQSRNPADINPGTLQPLALELLAGYRAHDLWSPALIANRSSSNGRDSLPDYWVSAAGRTRGMGGAIVVEPWRKSGSHVVVHGAPWPAQVLLNGQPIVAERLEYLAPTRSLVIALPDAATARLEIVARDE